MKDTKPTKLNSSVEPTNAFQPRNVLGSAVALPETYPTIIKHGRVFYLHSRKSMGVAAT